MSEMTVSLSLSDPGEQVHHQFEVRKKGEVKKYDVNENKIYKVCKISTMILFYMILERLYLSV